MMRTILFWLSERQSIFNFVRKNRMARGMASRFVAGETVEEAVQAALALQARGISTTVDLLGESVSSFDDVDAATKTYIQILDQQHAAGLEVNASLKLTQFGFDLDEARCEKHVREIVAHAEKLGGFIRLDMESSAYTERTLAFHRRLAVDHAAAVGVVIQSALRRSTADIEALAAAGTRVRLCKGAYMEPAHLAFPDKKDVDAHYVRLLQKLLTSSAYHGLATHDDVIIDQVKKFVTTEGISRDHFEFQMLYGVRRDLQDALVADGWRIRVYIPFGTHWYPYLMRRLAERPANIYFIVGSILKEGKQRT